MARAAWPRAPTRTRTAGADSHRERQAAARAAGARRRRRETGPATTAGRPAMGRAPRRPSSRRPEAYRRPDRGAPALYEADADAVPLIPSESRKWTTRDRTMCIRANVVPELIFGSLP